MARRLGIDRTVMTYLLDDLEAAGLDARFARAGQYLLAGLGPGDQAAFRRLLGVLAARVNDLDPVLTACDAVEDIAARGSG
jgi:hypothetical protein